MQTTSTGGTAAVRRCGLNQRTLIANAAAAAILGVSGAGALAQTPISWTNTTPGGSGYLIDANWDSGTAPTSTSLANINNGGRALIGGTDAALADVLNLGVQSADVGHVTISDTATLNVAELRVGGRETIPDGLGGSTPNAGGKGTFTQDGGTVNVNAAGLGVQSLYIGDSGVAPASPGANAEGTYTINAGVLNVGTLRNDTIVVGTGAGTVGTFVHNDGTVKSTGELTVARRGATGSYTISNGLLEVVDDIKIGNADDVAPTPGGPVTQGTFVQNGGVVRALGWTDPSSTPAEGSGSIKIGYRGGTGSYTMNGAASELRTGWDVFVGDGNEDFFSPSVGTFTQNAGLVKATKTVVVGRTGGTGTYTIDGGTLEGNNINVGVGGTGTFTQGNSATLPPVTVKSLRSMSISGSAAKVTDPTTTPPTTVNVGGNGTYTLESGTLEVGSVGGGDTLAVGNGVGSTGTFLQKRGSVTVTGNLQLGRSDSDGDNTYTIESGDLTIKAGQVLIGGFGGISGKGTYTQKGGTVLNEAGNTNVGFNTPAGTPGKGAVGVFNLEGGTFTMNKPTVGGDNGVLAIGNGVGASGTVNVSGGTLKYTATGTVIEVSRNNANAALNLSGTGRIEALLLRMGNVATGAGTKSITFSGGTSSITTLTLQNGNMTISGGTHTFGTINTSTGTLTLNNVSPTINTIFNLNGGSKLVSTGTVDIARTFNVGTATVQVDSGSLNLTGGVTNNNRILTKTGAGTLNINSAQTNTTAQITTTAGTVNLNTSGGAGLRVNANGGVTNFTLPSQTVGTLIVNAGGTAAVPAGGNKTLRTTSTLTIAGGRLDMTDNDLLVDYVAGASPETQIRNWVKDGRVAGSTTGIFSMPGSPDDDVVLAVADNAAWGKSTFNGINITTNTVVGKYTYFGDANLDGKVTGDDYVSVDANLGTGDSWLEGDFNMNGVTTGDDYVAIDANLGKGTPTPLAYAELKEEMVALHVEMFGEEYLVKLAAAEADGFGASVVPEPAAISLIGLGAVGLLGRRRRSMK